MSKSPSLGLFRGSRGGRGARGGFNNRGFSSGRGEPGRQNSRSRNQEMYCRICCTANIPRLIFKSHNIGICKSTSLSMADRNRVIQAVKLAPWTPRRKMTKSVMTMSLPANKGTRIVKMRQIWRMIFRWILKLKIPTMTKKFPSVKMQRYWPGGWSSWRHADAKSLVVTS